MPPFLKREIAQKLKNLSSRVRNGMAGAENQESPNGHAQSPLKNRVPRNVKTLQNFLLGSDLQSGGHCPGGATTALQRQNADLPNLAVSPDGFVKAECRPWSRLRPDLDGKVQRVLGAQPGLVSGWARISCKSAKGAKGAKAF